MDAQVPYTVKLSCKRCAAELRAEDIELDQLLARCPQCHTVSGIDPAAAGTAPRRAEIPLPATITVEDRGSALHLVRRWYGRIYIALAAFCLVWNLSAVIMYIQVSRIAGPGSILPPLFLLLPAVSGLGMTYFILAGFLNRTRIVVSPRTVRIEHGPMPWPGNRTVDADSLEQLFCEERTVSGSNGHPYYSLSAHLRGGRTIVLIKRLVEPEQALYFEKTIEQRLGIVDRPVPGELQ